MARITALLVCSSFIAALSSAFSLHSIVEKLGTYSISDVTVSGLSSGGFMAVQVHVAFSSIVNGSAIFAGVCCADQS